MGGLRANPTSEARALEKHARAIADEYNLKEKQRAFCEEFIIDYDVPRATARAGYKDKKYGYKLLEDKKITAAIKELQNLNAAYNGVNSQHLAGQMAIWAGIDITTFFTENWDLKDNSQLTAVQRSCIQTVEKKHTQFGTNYKVTFCDKVRANENLAKVYSLYESPKENLDMFDDMTEEEIEYWLSTHESDT